MKKILIIFYSIFLIITTIFSYVFTDSNINSLKDIYTLLAVFDRGINTGLYIACLLIFFLFYAAFFKLIQNKKFNTKDLKILIIITVIFLFFSYPAMLSFDIFNYIATAKVLFLYHENPYIIMPLEFARDPILLFMHAANKIALYGPAWILLTGFPSVFGFSSFLVTLFSFKLFVSFFYLALVFTIWKITKNITSTFLFSLNPLVIIETLISGHNDVVMIFFAIFSFFLLKKKRILLSILFIFLSIFIKYSTIFLLPIFIYVIFKYVKNKPINWENIFYYTSIIMLIVFLLSPIREEIYPWYAIWFLAFSFIAIKRKKLLYISLTLSFFLLLRYIPFMLTGTHQDKTPLIKTIVTFVPPIIIFFYLLVREKIWLKKFSR